MILQQTLANAGMTQYLNNASEDELYVNGLAWIQTNQNGGVYKIGQTLTESQVMALTKDMVIPVEQTINGQTVMVPQVYFCPATLAKSSIANNTAGGVIKAGGNLTLMANGDITNEGTITSGSDTTLIANNNFANTGGTIDSGNNLNIQASSVTFDDLLDSDGNNQIQNTSHITSKNDITITSTNDLNILGTSIQSGANTTLTSTTGNINIASESSSSSTTQLGGDYTQSSSKSVASEIKTSGDININAKSNISVLAGKNTDSSYFHSSTSSIILSKTNTEEERTATVVSNSITSGGNTIS